MAQRGRPPKKIFTEEKNNFLTEEKNLQIDNSPRVDMSDAEIEIKRELNHETLRTHDGRKISCIDLARKIKQDRVQRTQKYEQISKLYTRLGSSKELKIILKPNDDYEK